MTGFDAAADSTTANSRLKRTGASSGRSPWSLGARMVEPEKSEVPRHVYKYRDLGDYEVAPGLSNREALRDIFVDNKVWFASPATYNDPFDCRIHLEFERHIPPAAGRAILTDLQRDVNGLGVFSVSAKRDHILMWAYYSAGHSGICIEFALMKSFFRMVQPVKYSEEYPRALTSDPPIDQMEANLLTKAAAWKHEAEWRVIDTKSGPGYRQFNPSLLTGVILGARISPENESVVRGWIAEGPANPRLYRAVEKDEEYGLNIIEA